jgi:hypothetical protein
LKREDGEVNLKDFVAGGNLDSYLQKMSQQGEWADHIIVMSMAAYLHRDIIVITSSPNTNPDDNILWISSGNAEGDPLCLGHIWENHYQSLRPCLSSSNSGCISDDPILNYEILSSFKAQTQAYCFLDFFFQFLSPYLRFLGYIVFA